MEFQERLQKRFQPRFAIVYPLALYLLFFTVPDDSSLQSGIWFILMGIFIRIWANGYAIKTDKLTTCGPYAHVRNPLYLGSALIVAGFIVMLKAYLLGGLFLAAFAVVYAKTIRMEEGTLLAIYNQDFVDYRKRVPAFWPTLSRYPLGSKWPFSYQRLIQSREYKLCLWVLIAIIGFHLKDELLVEHEALNLKLWGLMALMLILAMSDIAFDYWRKSLRNN